MNDCIFCGQPFGPDRTRSREHIWPEWMHELLPDDMGASQYLGGADLRTTDDPTTTMRTFGGKIKRKIKPHVVCRPCNNGWMSVLERETKPVLRPMILGEKRRLTRERQATLATWFCLKNMVAEYTDPSSRATPDADREWLHDRRRPPPRTMVWITEHSGDEWAMRYRHHGLLLAKVGTEGVQSPPMNTQVVTFAAGRIVFHLFSRPSNFPRNPAPVGGFVGKVAQIWPVVRPLDWPIGAALTDAETISLGDEMLVWIASMIAG